MSPVFNDKFDMLMHIKRQDTSTGSNTNVSTPPASSTLQPTTSAAPTTTSQAETTTTSAAPTSTSQPPTSTSTLVTTSSSTSSVVSTSTTPTSTSVSTTSAAPTSTSAPVVSTTTAAATSQATAPVTTAAPSSVSRTSLIVTPTVIRTTSNGTLLTVTLVTGATESAGVASSTKKPFFQNTGAVIGVFVVVGIVATAILVVIATMFVRRRRAKQFDREVQEAAREAAHTQPAIDDDDDYAGGTSYNTHASQPMSTERPGAYGGYGATGASSWDPYGRAAAPGGAGYEMQHRRTSTGTAPGMAGFAAGDVFARGAVETQQGYNPNQGYGQGYAQDGYNTGYGQGYGGNQQYNNAAPAPAPAQAQYNNTSPPQGYALAQAQNQPGRAPVQAQMMMPDAQRHSYNTVGAFRQSPSYGEAHPGEQVEYGHAEAARGYDAARGYQQPGGQAPRQAEPEYAPRQSEDPYGGYEYNEPGPSVNQGHNANPPAYVSTAGSVAGATGDRKVGVGRQQSQSGRSGATRYSQDDDSDVEPPRRVLKVANE